MRNCLVICFLLLVNNVFGQFAVIQDRKGYANIRNSPNISNSIIDTLNNGTVIFCKARCANDTTLIEEDSGVDNEGFIHRSKLKFIHRYKKLSESKLSDDGLRFAREGIEVVIIKTTAEIEDINGEAEVWGAEGKTVSNKYQQVTVILDGVRLEMPKENLFEPNLKNSKVNYDNKSKTLYISATNGSGENSYAVLWVVANGRLKQRIVTSLF